MLVLFVILHSPLATKPATSDSKLRQAAYQKAYRLTEEYKAYQDTEVCKAKKKAYRSTEEYKDKQKAYKAKLKACRAKLKVEQEKELVAMALLSLGSNKDLKKKSKITTTDRKNDKLKDQNEELFLQRMEDSYSALKAIW